MDATFKKMLPGLYKTMYKIRHFEDEGVKLYRQGLIRGYFHPYWGEEAIATGVCAAITKKDYITSTHRGHGHCISWGAELTRMFSELLGKKTGYCKGLGGSMHIADITAGNLGANGIVGSGVPIAVGAALGAKIRNEKRLAVAFVSDGGSNIGSFSEALNLAAIWKLSVIFVIENNQYAVSTPVEESTGEPDLYKRGIGYGVESIQIDGNDVMDVFSTTSRLAIACRKGKGPFLIEAITFRHSGHHVNDPGLYLPKEKLDYYLEHDPLKIAKKYLIQAEYTEDEIHEIEHEVNLEIKHAIEFAKASKEMSKIEFLQFVEEY